jgi:hypothetical protein
MIRWSTSTGFLLHVGVLGQAAYLADPSKQILGTWVFVGLVMVPHGVLLFFRYGELSDEVVARAHPLAAHWYGALTLTVATLAAGGYRPRGWLLFLVFGAPGACRLGVASRPPHYPRGARARSGAPGPVGGRTR